MSQPIDSIPTEELLADMRWLRRFAARLVRDEGELDDLTQEAWAKDALQRARPWRGVSLAAGGIALLAVWALGPGSNSRHALDRFGSTGVGASAAERATLEAFLPFLGRWDPPADVEGESLEFEPGTVRGTLIVRQHIRRDGVELPLSEALVGWHPGQAQLVYHEFQRDLDDLALMYEGSAWFEGPVLCREFLAHASDGSTLAWRDRCSPVGAALVRRIEYLDEGGTWRHRADVTLLRTEGGVTR